MKIYVHKSLLLISGLVVFFFAQQIQAQEQPENLSLNDILTKLAFISRIGKSVEQINNELIKEIRERKVDFVLSSEDEEKLKKSDASHLLIKTIDENASEKVKEEIVRKVFNSVEGCNKFGLPSKQKEQLIEYGKQFIRVFSNDPEYEMQVLYIKKHLPKMEEEFAKYKFEQEELNKLLTESVVKNTESDRLKMELAGKFIENQTGNFMQKKIALEAAKEFVKKFGEEAEIRDLINYFKKVIPILEKHLKS